MSEETQINEQMPEKSENEEPKSSMGRRAFLHMAWSVPVATAVALKFPRKVFAQSAHGDHTDSAHSDSHNDHMDHTDHIDIAHLDAAHGDQTAYTDHLDQGTPHIDNPYADHSDLSIYADHADRHTDHSDHSDNITHIDTGGHGDIAHEDHSDHADVSG